MVFVICVQLFYSVSIGLAFVEAFKTLAMVTQKSFSMESIVGLPVLAQFKCAKRYSILRRFAEHITYRYR